MRIETERLILRQWVEADRAPFAAMNADGQVMRYFPDVQSRQQSDGFVDRASAVIEAEGWGFFALQEKLSGQENLSGRFIGFTGLSRPKMQAGFCPCVEIGWRLAAEFWGKGYATEAALACLALARDKLHLKEVVSFTSKHNGPSMAVMQRIGMTRDKQGDFEHPDLEPGHWITPHVLYRINL